MATWIDAVFKYERGYFSLVRICFVSPGVGIVPSALLGFCFSQPSPSRSQTFSLGCRTTNNLHNWERWAQRFSLRWHGLRRSAEQSLQGVLMFKQCRDELTVVTGIAVGGRICCLKSAKSVNLHHGNPQFIRTTLRQLLNLWQAELVEVKYFSKHVHGRIDSGAEKA